MSITNPIVGIEYVIEDIVASHLCEAGLSASDRRELNMRVACNYDLNSDALDLRLGWGSPQVFKQVRKMIPGIAAVNTRGNVYLMEAERMLKGLDVVGELYHMRLAREVKNIERVWVVKDLEKDCNIVHVRFKNGHELVTREDELQSLEFLATCGMVYDL